MPKAVSITAPAGAYAGITVMSGSGVLITASSGEIMLRGLTINSLGGTDGVRMDSGNSLQVDRSVLAGFSGHGVLVNNAGTVRYVVSDLNSSTTRSGWERRRPSVVKAWSTARLLRKHGRHQSH